MCTAPASLLAYTSTSFDTHAGRHPRHVPALERRFSSIREFEEFQTNPITHVVQDAVAAETGREVQRLCIVYAPAVSSARILEILVRMCLARMRICACICNPYARHRHVFAARHAYIYRVSRNGFLVESTADSTAAKIEWENSIVARK